MARFYADENFPLAAVLALRRLGHELLTTTEAGQSGLRIPDNRSSSLQCRKDAQSSHLTAATLFACTRW